MGKDKKDKDAEEEEFDATEEGEPEREKWARPIDFVLACIGFSVGLGNVWRFPFLCYKNGGAIFLIPYLICVFIGGIPMFYLEVCIGQYMQTSGIRAWRLVPLFQGLGICTIMIVFFLDCYYNIVLCWAFYYFFSSLNTYLVWGDCKNWWNTARCTVNGMFPENNAAQYRTVNGTKAIANETGITMSIFNGTIGDTGLDAKLCNFTLPNDNTTCIINGTVVNGIDSVTEFWENKVLGIDQSTGIDDPAGIKWDLALCNLFSWLVVYLCICKGIKTSGKVMYVTATSPYIFMLILLIRGVTLPGSLDGLRFYMVPQPEDWAKLGTIKIWVDAGSQIFFSMSIALGTLTALGSYNRFRHNSFRDTLIFAFANTGTSIFAGIVIFSVLGFMAYEQGVDIKDVAEGGPGLAFIAYPKALNQMPVAPLWSAFFFIMVILLGLDSQFVGVEGFIAGLSDLFPKLLRAGKRRWTFVAFVCVLMYLVGLSMVTRGGMFVLQLFDYYPCSRLLYLVAMIECIVVSWIYGVRRFYDHIQVMYGKLGGHCCIQGGRYYYMAMWAFFCPLFCLIMFILSLIGYSELSYTRPSTGVYNYPTWAVWTGWGLAFFTVSFIPIVMLIMFCWKYVCGDWEFRDLINPIGLKPFQLMPGESYRDTAPQNDTTEKYAADGSRKQDYSYANEGYKVDPNRF